MSVNTFVFLAADKLPTVAEWNAALRAGNFDLVLDSVDDLQSFSGFLPAKLSGHDAGFEWSFGPIAEVFGEAPGGIGERPLAANFATHSDMTELASALLAAAVLAKMTDGQAFDAECGELCSPEDLIHTAAEALPI